MNLESTIKTQTAEAIAALFNSTAKSEDIILQETRKDFEGDITIVAFSLNKFSKKSPEETGKSIGEYLVKNSGIVSRFNVVKGFLNLVISDSFWLSFFSQASTVKNYGIPETGIASGQPVVVEYSSPNSNKPLHLGHIRNNLLGFSVAELLKANGYKVFKVNLINDRGIHICKSMLAWEKWGKGETPESSGIKGDHLVGKYYVMFEKEYKKESEQLVAGGMDEENAQREAPLFKEAQETLRKWEAGDNKVVDLWKKMNGWVYSGFNATYSRMGIDFDKFYYESETYLIGKKLVEEGLTKGVFYKKPDGSVWVDLTSDGLDHKLLLRSDGTSVYITQDLGTALLRYEEYKAGKMIYVVGNEQDYHFKVLKLILKKLGKEWADGIHHLSYGMVDLPSGKMKTREGTVVDADDLMDEIITEAKTATAALGKIDTFNDAEANALYHTLGMGALKYFILKVDPQKRMLFDPRESIDLNGHTGPFIQYSYARIQSVLRKAATLSLPEAASPAPDSIEAKEKELLRRLYRFPAEVAEAGRNLSPALIANYVYELSKTYNQFYHELPIADVSQPARSHFRLRLSAFTGNVIQSGMRLLGIDVPSRM